MTQPIDFRKMLTEVIFWATDVHESRVKFLQTWGYEGLPQPESDPPNDSFYKLFEAAQEVMWFHETQLRAGAPVSYELDTLSNLLWWVDPDGITGNGTPKYVSIHALESIMELAQSILDGKPIEAKEPEDGPAKAEVPTVEELKPKNVVGKKRSTTGGGAKVKLIAALSLHHKYEAGGICFSCLNHDPIGNNDLARLAEVDKSTASLFFKEVFKDKGYSQYRQDCYAERMPFTLALLRGECSPREAFELFKNAQKAGLKQGEAE